MINTSLNTQAIYDYHNNASTLGGIVKDSQKDQPGPFSGLWRSGSALDTSTNTFSTKTEEDRKKLISALESAASNTNASSWELEALGIKNADGSRPNLQDPNTKKQLALLAQQLRAIDANQGFGGADAFSKGGDKAQSDALTKLRSEYIAKVTDDSKNSGIVDTRDVLAQGLLESVAISPNVPEDLEKQIQAANSGDGLSPEFITKLREEVKKRHDNNPNDSDTRRHIARATLDELNKQIALASNGKNREKTLEEAFKAKNGNGDPKLMALVDFYKRAVGANLPRDKEQLEAQVQRERASRGFGLKAGTEVKGDTVYKLATGAEQVPQEVQTLKNGITIAKGYTVDKVDGNIATVSDGKDKYQYRTEILAGGVRRTIVSALDENNKPAENETAVYIQKQAKKDKEVQKGNLYMVKGRQPKAEKALVAQRDKTEQRAIAAAKKEKELAIPKPIIASASAPATSTPVASAKAGSSASTSQTTAQAPKTITGPKGHTKTV
jgi:hypothetical protein